MSDNPNTSTAVGANVNPTENKFTDWLSHVLADLGKNGIFIALIAVVALFTILTERHPAPPAEHLEPRRAERLHPRSRHRHGDGHHRGAHRPLGRVGRGLRRSRAPGVRGAAGVLPWWLVGGRSRSLIGALVGAWQGFWVAFVGIPAFIVTLAGMLIFRGLALVVLGNANIGSFPDGVSRARQRVHLRRLRRDRPDLFTLAIGAVAIVALIVQQLRTRARTPEVRPGGRAAQRGSSSSSSRSPPSSACSPGRSRRYKGIPVTLIILAPLVLVYGIVMNRTVFGRHIYAIGGNRHAAELSGIKTRRVDFWLFVNMGFLAASPASSSLRG